MKKIIPITVAACFVVLLLSSCRKSFLNEKVYSNYSTLTDSLGFEAAVAGMSNQVSNFFTTSNNQGLIDAWYVGTDECFATAPEGSETPFYNYGTLTPSNVPGSFTWTWAYQVINNANIIIANVENPSLVMTTANKNYIDAEARFYRAYGYNTLATLFGRVPLLTQPLSKPKTDFVRSSLDSINAVITADLLYGATSLPDIDNVKSNSGGKMTERPNKAMAQQLLAEAYLRMGKPDLAEAQAQAVIGGGKFTLIKARYGTKAGQPGDYYSDMFWYGNQRRKQGNTENIWLLEQENPANVSGGITNSAQQRRNWGAAYYSEAGMLPCDSLGGRGISRMRLSNWFLYGLFEAGDMRNSKYNVRRVFYYNDPSPTYAAIYGKQVPYVGTDTVRFITPHITKWFQFDPNDVFGFAMIKDFPLMRLGETYLLLAEAQFRQGHLTDAAATLTTLRARSNASAVTAGQVTLDFILDERARELIGEENRRMTLMRTGTLVTRSIALNSNSVMNPLNGLTNTHLLLPIPQSEIDLNKDAKLDQNPGY